MSASPPNILWIVADELRADALGCYGAPIADTPNIDRLATRGCRFDDAFVNGPECVPSRASFMTGRYCKNVGVFNNQMGLELTAERRDRALVEVERMGTERWAARVEAMDVAIKQRFEAYTYPISGGISIQAAQFAALFGLVAELGLFEEGPTEQMLPELLAAGAGYRTRSTGKVHHNGPRSGYQETFTHPDEELHTPFGVLDGTTPLDPTRTIILPSTNVDLIGGGVWPLDESRNPDAVRAADVVDFLATTSARQPWFQRLSLIWPHTPVLPPEPWDRLFSPEQFRPAAPTAAELGSKSRYEALWRERTWDATLTVSQRQQAWSDYWGLVSYVDALVGRVIDALDASPFSDSTIVVFSSDHGTLLGEHGLWQKQQFYRPVVRAPLIISQTDRLAPGTVIDAPVQLVDIVPTLLDLCGIRSPANIDGVSLVPAMDGHQVKPHDYVFSEFVDNGDQWKGPVRRTVYDGEWRLEATVPNIGDDLDGVLYNLVDDPGELRNRYDERAVSRQKDRLLDVLKEFAAS